MNSRNVRFDENLVDAIFRDLDQSHLPGAAVGVGLEGLPVYRKGFGLASMDLPVTLTPQTRVRIYSITKHITCLAYLLLCEEGRAGIDDPIAKYLPELHPVTHCVTIRQLMSNTSGLRDACDVRWFFSGLQEIVSCSSLLSLYREIDDVNFKPGAAWCYNNGGYHILSAVIEKVADQQLEDVFRTRIFEPAGMHDTRLMRVDKDFAQCSASMHMLGPGGLFEKKFLPGELAGEGGIVSTIDDMLRWMQNIGHPFVGTSRAWTLMSTSQRLNDGVETGYGLGLFRCPYRGVDVISHSGGGLGSNSQMVRVPALDLDIIVSVNRSDVSSPELAARILDVCLGIEPEPARVKGRYVSGLFRSPTTGHLVHLFDREERQMAAFDGGEGMQMIATGDRELSVASNSFWNCSLKWDSDTAEPACIHYNFFGAHNELISTPDAPTPNLHPLAGEYSAQQVGVRATVTPTVEGGHLLTTGRFGSREYRLEGLGPDIWRIRSTDGTGWSGTLMPDPSQEEAIVIHTSYSRNIHFRRAR